MIPRGLSTHHPPYPPKGAFLGHERKLRSPRGAALSHPAGHCPDSSAPWPCSLAGWQLLGFTAWFTPVLPPVPSQWLGRGLSGRPGGPAASRVGAAIGVVVEAVWTPRPRTVVPPAPGPRKRGHPVACSPVQVAQVRGAGLGPGVHLTGEPRGGGGAVGPVAGPPSASCLVSILPAHPPDCGQGRVHVSAELCRKGLVPLCPPSCLDPEANRSCSGLCLEGETHSASRGAAGKAFGGGGGSVGVQQAHQPSVSTPPCCPLPHPGCRCPPGLLLQDAGCLPLSECPCLVGEELQQPGVPFLLDNCSRWSGRLPAVEVGGPGRGQGPLPAFRS